MDIDTDFHSHIVRSSPRQMVQKAREMGLRVLGLSEHVFQMSEARPLLPHMPQEGPFLTFDDYFSGVREAAEQEQFDVRIGLEVDFVPEKNVEIQQSIQGKAWDFLIGSVHQVNEILFESPRQRSREEGEALWQQYFTLLRQAASSGYFSLISHPVRMRSTNPFLPPHLGEELEHLAATATRHNVALEINGYDIRTYPNLVKRLALACLAHHTPLSIGSDAHTPAGIAQGHRLSELLLHETGLTKVRIWKKMVAEEYSLT